MPAGVSLTSLACGRIVRDAYMWAQGERDARVGPGPAPAGTLPGLRRKPDVELLTVLPHIVSVMPSSGPAGLSSRLSRA